MAIELHTVATLGLVGFAVCAHPRPVATRPRQVAGTRNRLEESGDSLNQLSFAVSGRGLYGELPLEDGARLRITMPQHGTHLNYSWSDDADERFALPFDTAGSLLRLSKNTFLISGYHRPSKTGYLITLQADGERRKLQEVARTRLFARDPWQLCVAEGRLHIWDARSREIVLAAVSGGAVRLLPHSPFYFEESRDFCRYGDLAESDYRIRTGRSGGVQLVPHNQRLSGLPWVDIRFDAKHSAWSSTTVASSHDTIRTLRRRATNAGHRGLLSRAADLLARAMRLSNSSFGSSSLESSVSKRLMETLGELPRLRDPNAEYLWRRYQGTEVPSGSRKAHRQLTLAADLYARARWHDARETAEKALEATKRLNQKRPRNWTGIDRALIRLASVAGMDDKDVASDAWAVMVKHLAERLPTNHPDLLQARLRLTVARAAISGTAALRSLVTAQREATQRTPSGRKLATARDMFKLAETLSAANLTDDARRTFQRAEEIAIKSLPDTKHPFVADCLENEAVCLLRNKRDTKHAVHLLEIARDIRSSLLGKRSHDDLAATTDHLALGYLRLSDASKAQRLLTSAYDIRRKLAAAMPPSATSEAVTSPSQLFGGVHGGLRRHEVVLAVHGWSDAVSKELGTKLGLLKLRGALTELRRAGPTLNEYANRPVDSNERLPVINDSALLRTLARLENNLPVADRKRLAAFHNVLSTVVRSASAVRDLAASRNLKKRRLATAQSADGREARQKEIVRLGDQIARDARSAVEALPGFVRASDLCLAAPWLSSARVVHDLWVASSSKGPTPDLLHRLDWWSDSFRELSRATHEVRESLARVDPGRTLKTIEKLRRSNPDRLGEVFDKLERMVRLDWLIDAEKCRVLVSSIPSGERSVARNDTREELRRDLDELERFRRRLAALDRTILQLRIRHTETALSSLRKTRDWVTERVLADPSSFQSAPLSKMRLGRGVAVRKSGGVGRMVFDRERWTFQDTTWKWSGGSFNLALNVWLAVQRLHGALVPRNLTNPIDEHLYLVPKHNVLAELVSKPGARSTSQRFLAREIADEIDAMLESSRQQWQSKAERKLKALIEYVPRAGTTKKFTTVQETLGGLAVCEDPWVLLLADSF